MGLGIHPTPRGLPTSGPDQGLGGGSGSPERRGRALQALRNLIFIIAITSPAYTGRYHGRPQPDLPSNFPPGFHLCPVHSASVGAPQGLSLDRGPGSSPGSPWLP